MTIFSFLSDRLGRLVLQTVFAAAATVFLLSTGTQAGVVVILLIVWLLTFGGVQCVDYIRVHGRLEELEAIMDHLDQKYLFAECIPKAQNAYERRLLELFRRAGKSMIEAVSDAEAAQREYRDYVESWVHEIKTPITAAGLICRSAESPLRQKLSQELAQIEAHVERALFYARAESPEKDFIIRQTGLEDIAASAISRHRTLLIQNGIRVEAEGLEYTVYTDSKWAVFILGQLLQNAARYHSDEPVITLSARLLGKQVQLTVHDNGIGIPGHELPRIFERGFTGSNGRSRGSSTGMGLYLCRKLTDSLEMELQIRSAEGEGTTATITFPARENAEDKT
ncbi:MAG: sensor histidine kinase [Acetatifactor sp.]|nr:sensor histidine kinase [Acetatifactor sp.]